MIIIIALFIAQDIVGMHLCDIYKPRNNFTSSLMGENLAVTTTKLILKNSKALWEGFGFCVGQ